LGGSCEWTLQWGEEYEDIRRVFLKGQLPGMTGAGLGKEWGSWKELWIWREKGDAEGE
jgi:hypothetical protein